MAARSGKGAGKAKKQGAKTRGKTAAKSAAGRPPAQTVAVRSPASKKTAPVAAEARPAGQSGVLPSAAERLAAKVADRIDIDVQAAKFAARKDEAAQKLGTLLDRWQGREAWQAPRGLVDRLRAWWWGRQGGRGGVDRRQLDEVKASVMSELKHMRSGRGEVVSGSPFANVMLPPVRRKAALRGWAVFAVLVVGLVSVLWWLGRVQPVAPEDVVARAVRAMEASDVKAFEQYVDVRSLSVSIVDQVLTNPRVDMAVLPDDLQAELQHGLKSRMEALIKPGLADKMAGQMRAAVAENRLPDGEEAGILGQVWHDLGGSRLGVGGMETVVTDNHAALVRVLLTLNGAIVEPALDVTLRQQEGRWQVVGLPNLAAVIRARDAVQPAATEERAPAAYAATVTVGNVVKAKGPDGIMLLSADLLNAGSEDIGRVVLAVKFADAAGVPLLETELYLPDTLRAGEARTQTWSVPLDMTQAKARYVYELPQQAMRVDVRVR